MTWRRLRAAMLSALLGLAAWQALADPAQLRARHAELRDELRNNGFGEALHIDSAESGDALKGDVYAVLEHPFARVRDALREPPSWCDILILPFNTKYCHAVGAADGPALRVRIGRKHDQPVEQAYRLTFAFRNVAAQADYFETRLSAAEGPLGTRDYRISVSAIPLEGGRTFMHLSYAYGYGMAGRLAMQAYLATVGADKVGFTRTGRDAAGQPQHIGGVRGAVERNAVRYYLAIDAYLDSLAAPPPQRVETRIRRWFDATERYPRQLREMDWPTYAAMKRHEYERQQTLLQ
ncbi:hypothetical protein [Ramlibacter tataouinensis]|uniref:Signal peptide protein-like protein n=1 Tax=Ramlibacter tataouinensis (strain ATCC BAA-407 / DSM 14655 / LMG 21543 / TTB310) TaxID=365046 RepID=F5XY69_RAMTT|nr:hypothetical protein [Ramlibacter tataouinensis]AEG91862.1 Signal peptide protein-like protein [Ramlibacter tataouinensis TTB310]